jgi:hypothetical protein
VTSPATGTVESENKSFSPISRIIQSKSACTLELSENYTNIRFYDLTGRVVLSGKTGPERIFEIDKHMIPSGIYLVSVNGEGSVYTRKILLWN